MKILRNILILVALGMISCGVYYLYPIANKKNISASELKSKLTEDSVTYKHWRIYYDLLNQGDCISVLRKYFSSARLHEDEFWFARMFALGVCVPKDEEMTFSLVLRVANEGYPHDIFHLGYLIEKGIGVEANLSNASEIYVAGFKSLNNLDEGSLDYISKNFGYVFYGEGASDTLKEAFQIALSAKDYSFSDND